MAELRARRLRRHAVVPARSFSRRRTRWAWRCRASPRRSCPREAFPQSLRDALARPRHRRLSGRTRSADLGSIAYETEAREGLVVDEGVLVEIVRPGTGDPVAPGEVGEVVVTSLFNTDYPLIRFGTGDLSAVLPGTKPVRAHEPAHQGLDGPRRPDDEGEGHVRASGAGRGDRRAPSGDRARRGSSSTTPRAPTA